jgi:hypothetical protein
MTTKHLVYFPFFLIRSVREKIYTYRAIPMPRCAVAFGGRFQKGMVVAWQENGMGTALLV